MKAEGKKRKKNIHGINYKRVKIIAVIKAKPGAIGTLAWHFSFSDTCINHVVALFLLFWGLSDKWEKTKSGLHMKLATVMCVFTLFVFICHIQIYPAYSTYNPTKSPKLQMQRQRRAVRKHPIQPSPCHYSQTCSSPLWTENAGEFSQIFLTSYVPPPPPPLLSSFGVCSLSHQGLN